MILHLYTIKEIKELDDIKLIKKVGYVDKRSHSAHDFYVTVNNEDCGGVCGFEAESEDIYLDYDADSFFVDILQDEMKASLVNIEEDRYDYYFEKQIYHCVLKIDIDEKFVEKRVNFLREKKKILDYNNKKLFMINSTNKMLSKENINVAAGYCDDYWKENVFEMSYDEARKKFDGTFACPFDNNLIVGSVHHANDIGWGCYHRCKLHSINKSPEHKAKLLIQHLKNIENDVYHDTNLSEEKGTTRLLEDLDLKQLEFVLKKVEQEEKKLYKARLKYEKENMVKLRGCSKEIFKDFKYLSDNNFLSNRFEDFDFQEDKIIYTYMDYGFYEEQVEIDSESIRFSIMPNMEGDSYRITLGDGCCVVIDEPITDSNKKALEDFYNKCKTYKSKYSTSQYF